MNPFIGNQVSIDLTHNDISVEPLLEDFNPFT